ncbi:hypothetical protein BT69DRAFT_1314959 [Atractiella rhizophila]|nr:hypothetical protein BT69DRAFT_1314959 [Atractiella rhizophila]
MSSPQPQPPPPLMMDRDPSPPALSSSPSQSSPPISNSAPAEATTSSPPTAPSVAPSTSAAAATTANGDGKKNKPPRPPRPKGAKMTACDRCRKFRRKCVRKDEEEDCESCVEKKWECVTTYIPLARTNWSKSGSRIKLVNYIFGADRPAPTATAPPQLLPQLIPGTLSYMPYPSFVFQSLPLPFPTATSPTHLQQLQLLQAQQQALLPGMGMGMGMANVGLGANQLLFPLGPSFPAAHRASAPSLPLNVKEGGRTKTTMQEKERQQEQERLRTVGAEIARAGGQAEALLNSIGVGMGGVDYRLGVSVREGALSVHLVEECITTNNTLVTKRLFPNLLEDFARAEWDSSKMGPYGEVIISLSLLRGARHSAHSALLGAITPPKKPALSGDLRLYGRSRESLCRILIMQVISKTLSDPILTNLHKPTLTNLYILRDVVITFWHLYPEQVEEVFKLEIRTWRELWKKEICWMEEDKKAELRDDICGYLILHDNVISRKLNKLPFLTDGELIAYMTTPNIRGDVFTDPLSVYKISENVAKAQTAEDLENVIWASTAVILRSFSILNHAFQNSTPSQCLAMLGRLWDIIVERRRWRNSTHTTQKPPDLVEEEEEDPRPPFIYYGPMGRESDGSTQLNQTEEAEIYFVFLAYLHKLEDRFYAEPEPSANEWSSPEPSLPDEFMRLKQACKEEAHIEIAKLALWVRWDRIRNPTRLSFVQWLTPYTYLPGGTGYLPTYIAENPIIHHDFTSETSAQKLVDIVIEGNKAAGWAGISFAWEVSSFEESFSRLSLSEKGSPPEDQQMFLREARESSQTTQATSQWQSSYNPFASFNSANVASSTGGPAQQTSPPPYHPFSNFNAPPYSLHNFPIPTSINQQSSLLTTVKSEPEVDPFFVQQVIDRVLDDISHGTVQ